MGKSNWRIPPTLLGIAALVRVLGRASPGRSVLGALLIVAAALLPIGVAVATGLLIGSIPAAVSTGLDSSAGQDLLVLLAVVGGLVLAHQVVTPLLTTLG